MLLSVEGYAALALMLNELAESVASRRILYILEGGYNLRALTDCVIRTIEVTLRPSRILLPETQTKAFDFYSESARNCFSPYWNCLS
jgi:acetoin utilization deacetylase AcuC-like enzyme